MIKKLILFSLIVVLQTKNLYAAAPYSKCLLKPTNVKLNLVDVENCGQKKVCPLKQGSIAKLTFEFTPDKDYKNVERVIYGTLQTDSETKELPFGKKEVICNKITGDFGGKSCKESGLLKGKTYKYVDAVEILPTYPKIDVSVRYIMREDNARGSTKPLDRKQKANWKLHPGETLLCLRIPVKIV